MSKKYTFAVEDMDEDSGKVVSTKIHTFTTDNESWMGFDGAMYHFLDFLKGEGYTFNQEEDIGVYNSVTDEVRLAHGSSY